MRTVGVNSPQQILQYTLTVRFNMKCMSMQKFSSPKKQSAISHENEFVIIVYYTIPPKNRYHFNCSHYEKYESPAKEVDHSEDVLSTL